MAFEACPISMAISVKNKQKVKSFEVISSDRCSYIYMSKEILEFFSFVVCFRYVTGLFSVPVCFLSGPFSALVCFLYRSVYGPL